MQALKQELEVKKHLDANGKKIKKKQAVLKTRKSIGRKTNSDSEDDFQPIKATKRKAPESKRPRPAAKDDDDDDDEAPPPPPKKRAPPKKPLKDEDDMDVDVPPPKKKAPAKKTEDSDSEVEVVKRAPRKAAKPVSVDSDEDADEPPKGKGKAKAAPKRKRYLLCVDFLSGAHQFLLTVSTVLSTARTSLPRRRNLHLPSLR